jgi:RNA polymerase sigma factor (sigma-70 family)
MIQKHSDINKLIVERCRNGEKKAFRELYDLYAKSMLNISIRILNNKEESEDVLQESFMSAFNNIGNFDGTHSFGAWLKRIVINRSLDVMKKKKIKLVPIEQNDFAEEGNEEEEDETVFDTNTIRMNLTKLPDGYRTILSLYLFEDLSHKEIAEMLNITESTSKSQYHRARKKLIELIKNKTITNDR